MTDAYSTTTPDVVDVEDDDSTSSRLDRSAERILSDAGQSSHARIRPEGRDSEDRALAPTASIRQAVRDDLGRGRAFAAERAEQAQDAIRDQPLKTAAYAVGVGVIIGLLLRR